MACIELSDEEGAGKCGELQVTAGAPSVHEVTATKRIPGRPGVCRTAIQQNVKQPNVNERCQWPGGRRTPNGMEGTMRHGAWRKNAESADQLGGAPPECGAVE